MSSRWLACELGCTLHVSFNVLLPRGNLVARVSLSSLRQCANQPQSIGVRGTSGRSRALKQTPVPETVAAAVYLLAPYQPTGIVVLPGDTPATTAKARALSKILKALRVRDTLIIGLLALLPESFLARQP